MIRALSIGDAQAAAVISRAARFDAIPRYPDLHTPIEDLAFYSRQIEGCGGLGEVDDAGRLRGFVLWCDQLIEHLYVDIAHQRVGIGSRLLTAALAAMPDRPVRLWTFQANARAVAFYRGHGFLAVDQTDGEANEESLPDVLFELR